MAEPTSAATTAAPLPDPELLSRAESFAREPFVLPGEDAAEALAPGTPRRRALDAALAEIEGGATQPSTAWRREFSLMLGLERVLSEDEPRLADGTLLHPHQVDALSGTLTALLAEGTRSKPAAGNATGNGAAPAAAKPVASKAAPAPAAAPPKRAADVDDEDDDELDLDDFDPDAEDEADATASEPEDVDEDEEPLDYDAAAEAEEQAGEAPEDPNAHKRFWFEHATGAGKTVAAMAFVEACRTGGILILTHRRNLVDQFNGELKDRGYLDRVTPPLTKGQDHPNGPVTVETYQWFVRNAGNISSAYTVVICDEAHTALGEKTAGAIREWTGPIFIGMTATGALIARHVTDLFPTQTSRFDLAQAARRGVIAPLRCVRIPPGPGVRTIAKVPLRRGEVDTEFDQEMLAELLDQLPFNLAAANLYKTRFGSMPGVVYAAGVRHAYNLAEAFREEGVKAQAVSGETPKRELAEILARYERGEIDVLVNAQLLAEGWNSPRATVCLHLAPTASKRIYQQRVGRVTRRHPGKEAGIVVDFVHPATKHDDPVVTLHSLLDRDVYRGGAIVIGPVRRGRGRRVRVERRVLPVAADENRRIEVFERELWRIAVEHLDWGEQIQWAALAGARVAPSGWRRARAMLHFDKTGELKSTFLLTAVTRNKNPQLRLRALQEIAASRDPEAFDRALDEVVNWPREEKREACKTMLQTLAEKRIGRRDQADAWIWRIAGFTAELHEEYAVQRWPETKRLLGLLANSSGGGHARNARRLVHAARKHDRRLSAALLAAATRYTHTPEAEEVLRGARTRMSRKPSSLSRELLRNFPKGRRGRGRRRKKKGGEPETTGADAALLEGVIRDEGAEVDELSAAESEALERAADVGAEEVREDDEAVGASEQHAGGDTSAAPSKSRRSRSRRRRKAAAAEPVSDADAVAAIQAAASALGGEPAAAAATAASSDADEPAPKPKRTRSRRRKTEEPEVAAEVTETEAVAEAAVAETSEETAPAPKPRRTRTRRTPKADVTEVEATAEAAVSETPDQTPKPKRTTTRRKKPTPADPPAASADAPVSAETPAAPSAAPASAETPAAPAEPSAAGETPAAKSASAETPAEPAAASVVVETPAEPKAAAEGEAPAVADEAKPKRRTTTRRKAAAPAATAEAADEVAVVEAVAEVAEAAKPKRTTTRRKKADAEAETPAPEPAEEAPKPKRAPARRKTAAEPVAEAAPSAEEAPKPKRAPARRKKAEPAADAVDAVADAAATPAEEPAPKPKRTTTRRKPAAAAVDAVEAVAEAAPKPKRTTTRRKPAAAADVDAAEAVAEAAPKPKRTTTRRKPAATADAETPAGTAPAADDGDDAPKPKRRTTTRRKTADVEAAVADAPPLEAVAEEQPTPKKRTTRRKAATPPDEESSAA